MHRVRSLDGSVLDAKHLTIMRDETRYENLGVIMIKNHLVQSCLSGANDVCARTRPGMERAIIAVGHGVAGGHARIVNAVGCAVGCSSIMPLNSTGHWGKQREPGAEGRSEGREP